MKTCFNCRYVNDDDACYCASCGADISSGALAEEQRFLDDCRRSLNHERRALRIVGIVFTVIAAIICLGLIAALIGTLASVSDATDEAALVTTVSFIAITIDLFVYVPWLLVTGIVNLVSASRTEKAMDAVYTDLSAVVRRNGSVKRIVFGAFFNSIAMIFIIINFSKLKSNRALIERIIARQSQTF